MGNNLLREKTSCLEFIVATCVATALLFFTNLTTISIGQYSLDGLVGWALLMSFAGISTYKSALPGLLIGLIWGLLAGCSMHMAINIATVFFGMYAYAMFSHLRPQSPLNVYEGALAGSVLHSGLTYLLKIHPCPSFIVFMLLELLISLGTFKAAVNKVRELGFINHEDPVLVAKIERDWVQDLFYNTINKIFKTNFCRPKKPTK
jgi:hypothetical protein